MMDAAVDGDYIWEGVKESPVREAYRNKMEFSFGDEYKDGPLALGMHKRGSFHDIVNVTECKIVDEDFRRIIKAVLEFATDTGLPVLSQNAPYWIFPSSSCEKGSSHRRNSD